VLPGAELRRVLHVRHDRDDLVDLRPPASGDGQVGEIEIVTYRDHVWLGLEFLLDVLVGVLEHLFEADLRHQKHLLVQSWQEEAYGAARLSLRAGRQSPVSRGAPSLLP
jgi:hypothetical protein